MEKRKIWVTGAGGQLGKELQEACRADRPPFGMEGMAPSSRLELGDYAFTFLTREDLSLDEPGKIAAFFAGGSGNPACVINCAAYTAVDKAEAEKEKAFLVNREAVGALAAACRSAGTRLIHISTDYVFDGNSALPLKEGDATGPVNVYGASKLLGERLAMENNPETVILRTSWVYSEFGNNFVKTMIRLMREKESVSVIDDQIGSPTYAADLASAILRIACGGRFVPGIYHYSNEGEISWYDFARAIKDITGSGCRVNPIPSSQYPTPAKRPAYSLLDKGPIKKTYGIGIPGWRESLEICLRRIGGRA